MWRENTKSRRHSVLVIKDMCPTVESSISALLSTVLRGVAAIHVYLFGLTVPPKFESSIFPQQTLSACYIFYGTAQSGGVIVFACSSLSW